ncbi:hypothetical protein BDN72DRAFT_263625 [Pluteus cervinus]|uniref:Uncharacterized protein n=1 Tax=Pluteus cervinus TaxID=181527 RepID=A0ACD3AFM7_9AGAR|nr:hypothetical protein BDN72DRAFT_263625 [Pluteus cervinus]
MLYPRLTEVRKPRETGGTSPATVIALGFVVSLLDSIRRLGHIRERMQSLTADLEDDQWGFGQVTAVLLWIMLLVQGLWYFIDGVSSTLFAKVGHYWLRNSSEQQAGAGLSQVSPGPPPATTIPLQDLTKPPPAVLPGSLQLPFRRHLRIQLSDCVLYDLDNVYPASSSHFISIPVIAFSATDPCLVVSSSYQLTFVPSRSQIYQMPCFRSTLCFSCCNPGIARQRDLSR